MKYKIIEFSVKNYRSITSLKLKTSEASLITICGSNNVGKTNVLRALKLFFNPTEDGFEPSNDIPHHIEKGSRGEGYKTTLDAKILNIETDKIVRIKQVFSEKSGVVSILISGSRDTIEIEEKEVFDILNEFKFILIEASNTNIPKLIKEIVNEEVLPLALDRRRGKNQKESLEKLEEFIESSKKSVQRIEGELTSILASMFSEVGGINTENWQLKIKFPEYSYLREAIANMIEFTLFDTNDKALETKGSGIQRSVLLTLIQYINSKTKRNVIWAIDEPEAFLQAGLQRSLYRNLLSESQKSQIFITTHSQIFININNLDSTFLLETSPEKKDYVRKKNQIFYHLNTHVFNGSDAEILYRIKENFGIENNDSWSIMPTNILVEGDIDKNLILALVDKFNFPRPNILVVGSADKFIGYLEFFNNSCSDLNFKPIVSLVFDNDSAGKDAYNKIVNKEYKNFCTRLFKVENHSGRFFNGSEIEDLIYPEVVFESANKILKNRGYKIINKGLRDKFYTLAYSNITILDFLNQMTKLANEDKDEINFNNNSFKIWLSKNMVENIHKLKINEQTDNFSSVKKFIKQICNLDD